MQTPQMKPEALAYSPTPLSSSSASATDQSQSAHSPHLSDLFAPHINRPNTTSL